MFYLFFRNFKNTLIILTLVYLIIQVALYFKIFANDSFTPVLLWWTPFMPKYDRIIDCGEEHYQCISSNNRNHITNVNLGAILYYGSQLENHDFPLPRNNNILWAIFHEESPKNYAPYLYENIQMVFNLSSTFSRNSSFPVPLQYLTDINSLIDLTYYVPLKNRHGGVDNSPVLYVQSDCDTPIDRDKIVKELGKYVQIDSYGACLNNKTFPQSLQSIDTLDLYDREYMRFISQYKFVISIENAACYDYVTEKLWRPLIVGAIPIYFGAPNIRDWLPNEHSAILLDDFENIKELGKYINQIDDNDELYNEYLQHKTSQRITNNFLKQFTVVEHPITDFECYVCSTLYKKETPDPLKGNVYHCPAELNRGGSWDQHWSIGKCQAKALYELLLQNVPYTAKDFEKKWLQFFQEQDC